MVLVAVMRLRERMGSGGLRGLQILRSGASRVRGGFDSHAFPPILAVVASLLVATVADAQVDTLTTPGDAPPDSGQVVAPAEPPTATITEIGSPPRVRTTPVAELPRFEQPRWVMMRSLVVPGWGQAHNGAWFKAAGVAVGELALIKVAIDDEKDLKALDQAVSDAQDAGDEAAYNLAVAAYNDKLAQATSRRWFLGALIAYSLMDAYFDAHFTHFKVEFGTDNPPPGGKSSGHKGRVAMRWTF